MMILGKQLYTPKDAARIIGMHYTTFMGHLKKGYIPEPTVVIGKRKYYSEDGIQNLKEFFDK